MALDDEFSVYLFDQIEQRVRVAVVEARKRLGYGVSYALATQNYIQEECWKNGRDWSPFVGFYKKIVHEVNTGKRIL